MEKQFDIEAGHIRAKLEYIKNDARSESGLFLKAMEQAFTVVNKIEPVKSTKPLEIFYYVPLEDGAVLDVVSDCICLTWLANNSNIRQFDFPMTGRRGFMSSDISRLPLKWERFPTDAQQDELLQLGINCVTAYMRRQLCLLGDVIWRDGQRIRPTTFPPSCSDWASMVALAQQISYADVLKINNPQWQ